MSNVTKRQNDAYKFICEFITTNEYSPTFDEIAKALGLNSKSGVHRLLHGLRERGLINIRPHHTRCIGIERPQIAEFHLRQVLRQLKELPAANLSAVKSATRFLEGAL